jgi:hypothetical protein
MTNSAASPCQMISPRRSGNKKPGGRNESSSRVEVICWNYEKLRSSLPELIETNVSFSSRPPFSWRELSLLFS